MESPGGDGRRNFLANRHECGYGMGCGNASRAVMRRAGHFFARRGLWMVELGDRDFLRA